MRPARSDGDDDLMRRSLHGLLLQSGLHGVEQRPVEDRLVLAGMDLAAIGDLADIEAVLQEMRERADTIALGGDCSSVRQSPGFGLMPSALSDAASAPIEPSRR